MNTKAADVASLHQKIIDLETSYEGKVDKQIVKSLLISYFATGNGSQARTEAERLMARFLDFNEQEMAKAGIRIGRAAKPDASSFTSSFVEFLEAESKKDKKSGGLKDSTTAGASIVANPQTMELARDLNKRLGSVGASAKPLNPFVPHPSQPGHHRTPSTASTGSSHSLNTADLQGNALFAAATAGQPSTMNIQPVLQPAATGGVTISDIVRDAVERDDEIV